MPGNPLFFFFFPQGGGHSLDDLEFGGLNLGRLNGSKETNQVKERDDDTLIHNNIYWTDSLST